MRSFGRRAALLALAIVACGGPGGNQQLQQQFEARCNAFVGNGETVRQASGDLGFAPDRSISPQAICQFTDAKNGWVLPPGNKCQDATVICQRIWQVLDTTLCSGGVGGCVYACIAYSPGAAGAPDIDDSVICGAKFVAGQGGF